MAETSFPVIERPLTANEWSSVTRGIGDGVLDGGGNPYALSGLSNATNTATIGIESGQGYAHAILRGFYHKIDEPVTVSLPAVTTTTTYYIVLQYSPVRTGEPIKLLVLTALDYTQDKAYIVLHTVKRQRDQLLTDAEVVSLRPRIAPTLLVWKSSELPDHSKVAFGTLALAHGENRFLMATSSGWKDPLEPTGARIDAVEKRFSDGPEWKNLILASIYVGGTGNQTPQYAIMPNGEVVFRGRVSMKNGGNFETGKSLYFGRLGMTQQWDGVYVSALAGTGSSVFRLATSTGGTGGRELEYFTSDSISWVDLSGMRAWVKR